MNIPEILDRTPPNVEPEVSYRLELLLWLREIALQMALVNDAIERALAEGRIDELYGARALPRIAKEAAAGATEDASRVEPA